MDLRMKKRQAQGGKFCPPPLIFRLLCFLFARSASTAQNENKQVANLNTNFVLYASMSRFKKKLRAAAVAKKREGAAQNQGAAARAGEAAEAAAEA